MDEKKSLDIVYRNGIEIPDNSSDPVHAASTDAWEEIAWETPELPESVQEARANITADLHFLYMTHLTMLGNIVGNEPDMERKRLAAVLTNDRMRKVDAWSKYITTIRKDAAVTDEMDYHTDDLLSEDSVCQLVSIVLADVFLVTLYQHTVEDTLFHRVLERDVKAAQKNIAMAINYLQDWYQSSSAYQQSNVANRITACVQWTEVYVDRYNDVMKTAGIDGEAFIIAFRNKAQQYQDRLESQNYGSGS